MTRVLCISLLVLAPTTIAAQEFQPSHRQLLGCFGEAFTLVEHVWRLAPRHLAQASAAADDAGVGHGEFLAGFVAAAVNVDQEGAYAVVRNLDGCVEQAITTVRADATTRVLAAAVRTEIDSALEDVGDFIATSAAQRDRVQRALRPLPGDRESGLGDRYDAFGERMKRELTAVRARVDALVKAATP